MKYSASIIFSIGIGFALMGCEKEKDEDNFANLVAKVESPTGEFKSADDAKGLALAFEEQVGSFGGQGQAYNEFRNQSFREGNQVTACPFGGEVSISAEGNEKQATADIFYDHCCYLEDCCYDGMASWFYSSNPDKDDFLYCGQWDLSAECFDIRATTTFDGCVGSDGMWYVLEYKGEVFVVSGSLIQGTGNWKVRTVGGTWECSAIDGKGKCTRGKLVYEW